jgi:pyrimidine operon attenuation protein/uracil phosphoribosyltransferase
MESFPSAESVAMLKEMKVRYIVVDVKEYGGDLTELRASCEQLGLEFAGDFEGEAVFLLKDGVANE